MHDLLITGGVYALLGREVTASTVAALLTILGFSLYDTIVVFDRVRENIPRMPNAAFSQIYNRSMSEVIVRSLATSFCAALPILALLLFGGETLQDFAFALLVGTLSGTYSSVFIAGPVLTHWKEREPVYKARERADPPASSAASCRRTRSPTAGAPVDVAPKERASAAATADAAERSVAGRLERRSSTRWCATSASRKEPQPAAARARRPPGRRSPRALACRAADSAAAAGRRRRDGDGDKPKKPRNRRHGRPR